MSIARAARASGRRARQRPTAQPSSETPSPCVRNPMTIEPQNCFAPPPVHQITQGGAPLLLRKGAIQTLLARHDFEHGAVRFDLMNLAAQRSGHGGWVSVC